MTAFNFSSGMILKNFIFPKSKLCTSEYKICKYYVLHTSSPEKIDIIMIINILILIAVIQLLSGKIIFLADLRNMYQPITLLGLNNDPPNY